MSDEKQGAWECLGYIRDDILPSFLEILMNHHKDPYKPFGISFKVIRDLFVAQMCFIKYLRSLLRHQTGVKYRPSQISSTIPQPVKGLRSGPLLIRNVPTGRSTPYIGDKLIPPLTGNLYNGYLNPYYIYYWVDEFISIIWK